MARWRPHWLLWVVGPDGLVGEWMALRLLQEEDGGRQGEVWMQPRQRQRMLRLRMLWWLRVVQARGAWVLYTFCWGECAVQWGLWGRRYRIGGWVVRWLPCLLWWGIQVEAPGSW